MGSLYAKLRLLLAGAVVAIGGTLAVVMQTSLAPMHWLEPWGDVIIGSIVGAALAAIATAQFFVRRLRRLGQAVTAFDRAGFAAPLRIGKADANGDALAKFAAALEAMSERVVTQRHLLDRMARQRRELLANVSHDLRTPLASMQGYLELLLMRHGSLEPAEERNYLETAARQSERLARRVGDLFHLTELEAEDKRLQSETFAVAELVQDVVQKFEPETARRSLQLTLDIDPRMPQGAALQVHADVGLVARLLENLVENAVRHTPAGGGVRMAIGCDGLRARIAVRDTGTGIAAEDIPGLFEHYYRVERVAGSGAASHAGLGLAIARRIVQLHGGELIVSSQPGRGTEVAFDLPLAAPATSGATDSN